MVNIVVIKIAVVLMPSGKLDYKSNFRRAFFITAIDILLSYFYPINKSLKEVKK